eukprot:CAMPEP_0206034786 /NCGR_PEP_ID=MMETSP1466-20131121/1620_1 /ASSEMBLY_ACC=CAM_ASM_001126 /TAXON_ID=44452 /ORGANISM="Pavlova gyrans, Strain CCMP608" /LENGTH=208 /DNA_ID=CAMNT_0053409111 /DNA_START=134 /DNA_END=761 /DNA_ORIENTATION=-
MVAHTGKQRHGRYAVRERVRRGPAPAPLEARQSQLAQPVMMGTEHVEAWQRGSSEAGRPGGGSAGAPSDVILQVLCSETTAREGCQPLLPVRHARIGGGRFSAQGGPLTGCAPLVPCVRLHQGPEPLLVGAPQHTHLLLRLVGFEGGHGCDLAGLGRLLVVIHVNLAKDDVWELSRELLKDGGDLLAGAAPRGGEIHDDRLALPSGLL